MDKPKGFMLIFVPAATVFISSFCIMVLELVASRLIARHLGSSLYTWTSVIGVILTGITIGNYLGGRIADKFDARKAVATIFAVCSVSCVTTVVLNNIAGNWIWLWHFNWPLRVFSHVSLVFLIPSTLLGAISPVVAKMALDSGLPTGRTVGDIYACGAAGSIAGTFAAGYWLIAAMGTVAIIWVIGVVLLLMSILYWKRFLPLYIWVIIFTALMTMAMIPAEWAKNTSSSIALREGSDPNILYEDESRYSHIIIKHATDAANKRLFYEDKLKHSEILMDDMFDLQYFYTQIYAAVTEGLGRNKEKLNIMAIGGGGYVFPRYVEKLWPGSRIDVAEIDPAVTRAAIQAFGMESNTTINTIHMDGRNYVDQLLEQKRSSREIPQYDFVYGDAFNNFSVPFQLVTQEFNEKIFAILSDDGVYMINVVDIFDSGLFAGSVINTLEKTFPNVYVATENENYSARNTFIIIASKQKLDLKNIISQYKRKELKPWYLNASDISRLRQKSQYLVLTDDYSPVENLLAPVVRDDAKMLSAEKFIGRADEFKKKGRFAESIENCILAIKIYPAYSMYLYNEIGFMYARMGNQEQAVEAFNKALEYNGTSEPEHQIIASIHYSLGAVLKSMNRPVQATEQFRKAAEEFREELTENPANSENWNALGNVLATIGDFNAATEAFEKAQTLNPAAGDYYDNLVIKLESNGRYNEAIEILKKQIRLAKHNKQDEAVPRLGGHIKALEHKIATGRWPD